MEVGCCLERGRATADGCVDLSREKWLQLHRFRQRGIAAILCFLVMAERAAGQDRWALRPPAGLDQLASLALPLDVRDNLNTAPPEATLDGLLEHPRLPSYLGKLYREIIALRKAQHIWLSPDESSAQVREMCLEMSRLVTRLNDPHISNADSARVHAELRAAILGMRSVARSFANLKPSMLAKTNLVIMQQFSTLPADLVRSVHLARMADAKLSPEQCRAIVSANITMCERLQQTEAERRELLQPLSEVLQGARAADGSLAQLASTFNFHSLVDRQICIRDAECDAIVKFTANFTRTDVGNHGPSTPHHLLGSRLPRLIRGPHLPPKSQADTDETTQLWLAP
ncbi:hypothetical protein WJX73_009436 [Symbiochloris irregularis]|uniref:Secreted protein n=1 Tax=Symbiochloris irregularis TaxID=706552 RepID=A0AAW1PV02_9CHLO